jgi:hypothetical protein
LDAFCENPAFLADDPEPAAFNDASCADKLDIAMMAPNTAVNL